MPKSDVMITLICAKSDQRNVLNGKYIQQATITMNINAQVCKYTSWLTISNGVQ